jgi:hypothetical protein
MTDQEVRLECLRIAVSVAYPEQRIPFAREAYRFVTDTEDLPPIDWKEIGEILINMKATPNVI